MGAGGEMADALALGASERNLMRVRLLLAHHLYGTHLVRQRRKLDARKGMQVQFLSPAPILRLNELGLTSASIITLVKGLIISYTV